MIVNLDVHKINRLFAICDKQSDILFGLYAMVIPSWDRIDKVNQFPECSNDTWESICGKFIAFDKIYHPQVISGGCWLNHGFDINRNMEDWTVNIDLSKLRYKMEE